MRKVRIHYTNEVIEAYAIVEESNQLNFLIRAFPSEYSTPMNPYHMEQFFGGHIHYVDKSLEKYKDTEHACDGYKWIIMETEWDYFDNNENTVATLKEEIAY
ncbi:hypothetical protein_gp259 [Bacillus phage vB_BceM_WH1]|nr:hypothetical protein_gp259 [Bacillus phage vB_BceM_WH1]